MPAETDIVEHLVRFVRTLRAAGLQAGPRQLLDALAVGQAVGFRSRTDLGNALATTLVRSPEDRPVFNQAFNLYFRSPELLRRLSTLLLPSLEEPAGRTDADTAGARRLLDALGQNEAGGRLPDEAMPGGATSASFEEVLRERDFAQMSVAELADARRLMRRELAMLAPVATRRFRGAAPRGRVDLAASFRRAARNGGEIVHLQRRDRRRRVPPVVLLIDISGSMSEYSRIFLQFAHALTLRHRRVSTFVFGTRLSHVTRQLTDADIDRCLAALGRTVTDWDGGTRISTALARFNRDWARRVLAGRAVVLLMTDGLEREAGDQLGEEAKRLRLHARRVFWLNPLLRFDDFEPRARGMQLLLPYCDELLSAHNVNSLTGIGRLLDRPANH